MRIAFISLLLAVLCTRALAEDPKPECDAKPLASPRITVSGLTDKDDQEVTLKGPVLSADHREGAWVFTISDGARGEVVIHLDLPQSVNLDFNFWPAVEIDYRHPLGFEGRATGLRISDADGIVLLVDDGQYGNALRARELEPFAISQEDAGCRNRKNTPGDLNNFWLVVKAGDASGKLIQGQTGDLTYKDRAYTVIAIQSTARVDNVTWTDAPYEYVAYAIVRQPKK